MSNNLLIVDDDPIIHLISKRFLSKIGFEEGILSFMNGQEAMDFISESYQNESKYLILLDLNMPIMNGWEFLESMRSNSLAQNENITIIVVTSSIDKEDEDRARAYEIVHDYLSKPLTLEQFEYVLEALK
ncbi:MAG: response regulator [Cryomorphaceae bacterium]|nr:response regulator [Cryomorphaceae bacterium]